MTDSSPPSAPRCLSRWQRAVREGWWDGTRLPPRVSSTACHRDIHAVDPADTCFWVTGGQAYVLYSTLRRDRITPASHSDSSPTSSIQDPTTARPRHRAHNSRRNLRPPKQRPRFSPSRLASRPRLTQQSHAASLNRRSPGTIPNPAIARPVTLESLPTRRPRITSPPASWSPLPPRHWPEQNRTPKRRCGQGCVRNIPCQALKPQRPQVTPPRVPPHMVRGERDWLTRVLANGGGPGDGGV